MPVDRIENNKATLSNLFVCVNLTLNVSLSCGNRNSLPSAGMCITGKICTAKCVSVAVLYRQKKIWCFTFVTYFIMHESFLNQLSCVVTLNLVLTFRLAGCHRVPSLHWKNTDRIRTRVSRTLQWQRHNVYCILTQHDTFSIWYAYCVKSVSYTHLVCIKLLVKIFEPTNTLIQE